MRIAQITQDWAGDGGVGRYAQDLVTALRAAGHEVQVVRAAGPGDGDTIVPDFSAYAGGAIARARADAVMDALSRFVPDVVHVQANNNFLLETDIQRRYPSVKSLHVYDFCPSGNKHHHATGRACVHATGPLCLARMAYKRCTLDKRPTVLWRFLRRAADANRCNRGHRALIVASEYVRRAAVANGCAPAQVHALPYFTVPPPEAPGPPEGRTIMFSGRIVREKGLHVLLKALALVATPWRLVVAGDGMDRPRVERLVQRCGLGGRVRFLGWCDRDGVARGLADAAVVAVPSLWPEPFGIVGLEAMAHARPVVAFAAGGVPEWLTDGETGFLAPTGDAVAMARRLSRVLDDPALAASLGARGRARVERDFSAARHLDRLLEIYGHAMTGRVRPEPPAERGRR